MKVISSFEPIAGRLTAARYGKVSALVALGAAGAMSLGVVAVNAGQAGASVAAKAPTPVTVELATVPKLGKVLVTTAGLPLYYDTANKPGKWACTGDCLTAWPALTLNKGQKAVMAGAGVTGLGTVKSPSGVQVTWHGKALYTFFKDSKDKAEGQGLQKVWYVAQVTSSAKAATAAASGSSSSGGW